MKLVRDLEEEEEVEVVWDPLQLGAQGGDGQEPVGISLGDGGQGDSSGLEGDEGNEGDEGDASDEGDKGDVSDVGTAPGDVEGEGGEDDGQHVGQDDEPAAVTRRLLLQNIQSNIMHLAFD